MGPQTQGAVSARAIDALANFSHLLATKASSDDVKELLVAAATDLGAAAAVFVEVDADGVARITASRGYEARPTLAADELGDALGDTLTRAVTTSRGTLAQAERFDLVVGGENVGMLVLLFTASVAVVDESRTAIRALADIGAVALAPNKRSDDGDGGRASAQAEKLRALGGMAAGISHDLKNVFGPLLMQLDVLARKDDADVAFLKERLEKMRRPLERGLLIVERLRSFSKRSGSDEREVVDVHTVVDDAIGISRPKTVGTDVEIVLEPGDAPQVRVDVAEMVAALTNVLASLIESSTGGANGRVSVLVGRRDGGAVVDVITARAPANGGAGFAMMRDFARRHGGTVELARAPNGDARLSMWLPAATGEPPADARAPSRPRT